MAEHCDFDEQRSTTTADGLLRPDMIVHLPGGGQVVIDSKVPLDAFLHFTEAEDEDERKAFLKKHANQLRTHVDQLAKKEYWRQFERSPEFVVAFIPGESLLAAACEADPGLQDHALGKGIVLATPNTLVAALKTIALSWQQETLAENAREVRELGAELYERLTRHDGAHAVAAAQPHLEHSRPRTRPIQLLRVARARHRPQVPRPRRRGDAVRRDRRAQPQSRRPPATCRPASPICTTTRCGNRPSWRCPRAAPAPARRSPHGLRAGGFAEPVAREHRRRTLPGCCTSTDPIAPTRLVSMLRRIGGRTARGPDDARGRLRPDEGHRAVAHVSACRPDLGVTPGATGRGVRQHRRSRSPGRWSPARSLGPPATTRRPTPGCPNAPCGRCMEVVEEHFDEPWLAPLADHIRNAGATPTRTRRERRSGPSASRSSGTSPTSSIATPCTGPTWCSAGPEGSPQPGRGSLAGRALAAPAGAHRPAEPGGAPRRTPAPCSGKSPTCWTCPDRLSLFGLTRLPASYLDVLDAIAGGRDVHLFLLHPSPALWKRLETQVGPETSASAAPRRTRRHRKRATRCSRRGAATPARCSSSSAVRETHGDEVTADAASGRANAAATDPGRRPGRPRRRPGARRWRTATRRPLLAADDDSIRVHSCHGRGRQVEVLRDAILHLLEDDPDLEPRDVIVMCPDIEHFAPLIQATFGAHDEDGRSRRSGTRQLEIRLADRSLRQTNPVMGVLAEVLDLATGADDGEPGARSRRARAGAPAVPLRRRRPRRALEQWVAGVQCALGLRRPAPPGLRARTHRGQYLADRAGSGPARRGDGRGTTSGCSPGRSRSTTSSSGDIELAGRLAELVERLALGLRRARRATTPCASGRTSWRRSPTR